MSKDVTLIVRAEQNKSAAEKYTNEARINHSDNLAVRCHGACVSVCYGPDDQL